MKYRYNMADASDSFYITCTEPCFGGVVYLYVVPHRRYGVVGRWYAVDNLYRSAFVYGHYLVLSCLAARGVEDS